MNVLRWYVFNVSLARIKAAHPSRVNSKAVNRLLTSGTLLKLSFLYSKFFIHAGFPSGLTRARNDEKNLLFLSGLYTPDKKMLPSGLFLFCNVIASPLLRPASVRVVVCREIFHFPILICFATFAATWRFASPATSARSFDV